MIFASESKISYTVPSPEFVDKAILNIAGASSSRERWTSPSPRKLVRSVIVSVPAVWLILLVLSVEFMKSLYAGPCVPLLAIVLICIQKSLLLNECIFKVHSKLAISLALTM